MGFLIFAYRKIALKTKINDLNYKLMMLQMKSDSLAARTGSMTEAMSNAKEMMSNMTSSKMSQMQGNIFNQCYDVDAATGKRTLKPGVDQTQAYMEFQNGSNQILMQQSLFSSYFASQEKAQMVGLNQQDKQITQQKGTIETQLKQLNSEYDGVEKAEDDAAKKEAPKFGL